MQHEIKERFNLLTDRTKSGMDRVTSQRGRSVDALFPIGSGGPISLYYLAKIKTKLLTTSSHLYSGWLVFVEPSERNPILSSRKICLTILIIYLMMPLISPGLLQRPAMPFSFVGWSRERLPDG